MSQHILKIKVLLRKIHLKVEYLFFDSCDATTCRPWYDLQRCPKYDGKFLEYKAGELLKENRLSDTLTNVVIPTFDEKKTKPIIFSNYKVSMI